MNPKTGEVEHAGTKSGPSTPRVPSKLDALLHDAKAPDGDAEVDPYEAIIQQVLNADSPTAVLTPIDVLQGRDLIDEPLLLMDFSLNESEYDTGSPLYASMAVIRPDEGPTVVNCGHKKVLAQLVKLKQFADGPNEEWCFPYRVKFITRGESKQGTPLLQLAMWKEEDYTAPPF